MNCSSDEPLPLALASIHLHPRCLSLFLPRHGPKPRTAIPIRTARDWLLKMRARPMPMPMPGLLRCTPDAQPMLLASPPPPSMLCYDLPPPFPIATCTENVLKRLFHGHVEAKKGNVSDELSARRLASAIGLAAGLRWQTTQHCSSSTVPLVLPRSSLRTQVKVRSCQG